MVEIGTHRAGRWLLGLVLIAAAFLIFVPRIAQSRDYHQFANRAELEPSAGLREATTAPRTLYRSG